MVHSHKPSFMADTVVLAGHGDDMQLLVIRRGRQPFGGELALPGGFVEPFEPPLVAALRELREETGLDLPVSMGFALGLRAKEGRDPRGWTITQPFLIWLPETRPVRGGDDAADAFWLPLSELEELAFDHGSILCEALGAFWETMPALRPQLQHIPAFGEPNPRTDRAIFFGGSFNPWHEGHDACLERCPEPWRVVVVPDTNPFKPGPDNRCFWRAYREIRARVEPLGCAVFPGFCGLERPNPTVRWLPFSGYEKKAFLMGDDTLRDLPRWNEAPKLIAALTEIQVVPRLGEEVTAEARLWVGQQNPNCKITMLATHAYQHLSSTAIREGGPPYS